MRPSARGAALCCLVVSAAALATALASEHLGGLVPCGLCLWERWPYRVAIVLSLAASLAPARLVRPLLGLVLLATAAAAALALLHVGVEQGWWPSPLPECAAPVFRGGTMEERLSNMPLRPAKPCDDATYLVPGLPLSMAAMNAICALALSLLVAISLIAPSKRPR